MRQLHTGAQRHLPQMRPLRRHQRLFISGFGRNHTMDEKLIRMLIQYKDEFDRAPDNLSLVACTALLDLYFGRLAACGFDESTAMGILSAIFGLRDRRDPSGRSTKQVHRPAALARRTEQANAKVPAAA